MFLQIHKTFLSGILFSWLPEIDFRLKWDSMCTYTYIIKVTLQDKYFTLHIPGSGDMHVYYADISVNKREKAKIDIQSMVAIWLLIDYVVLLGICSSND